jgi:hypothetical protein
MAKYRMVILDSQQLNRVYTEVERSSRFDLVREVQERLGRKISAFHLGVHWLYCVFNAAVDVVF